MGKTKRLIARLLMAAFAVLAQGNFAMAVEQPDYVVLEAHGDLEIRRYPSLVVAEVLVTGAQSAATSSGFRKLAGYIFGGNAKKQSIAMTAPVVLEPHGAGDAAEPGPLPASGAWAVRFVMPKALDLEALPPPADPAVRLRRLPAGRFAVLRFSGIARAPVAAEKGRELETQAKALGFKPCGPPALLQYDPPWTLWFMRRNEVMAPLDCAG